MVKGAYLLSNLEVTMFYVSAKEDPLTETADIAAETKTVDKMPACVCRSGLRGKIP